MKISSSSPKFIHPFEKTFLDILDTEYRKNVTKKSHSIGFNDIKAVTHDKLRTYQIGNCLDSLLRQVGAGVVSVRTPAGNPE